MADTPKLTATMIEARIRQIRAQRVMLDFELAELYGIETRVLNQAVERNIDRFPEDFAFQLTPDEHESLMSQIVTSKIGRGGRRKREWAFTEHGVAMLASVLRSPMAVKVNIEIIRAFVKMRRLLATPGELLSIVQQLSETVELHDKQIAQIARVLNQLLNPPQPTLPKRKMGFHPPETPK